MKSLLRSLLITLGVLIVFQGQSVSGENYQEKTTNQETKPTSQEQKLAITLQDYVGRYQADPSMVENFILDVFVEKDQLWIKPSHSPKSQLEAKSADNFVITAVNEPIIFDRDAKGVVQSLTLAKSPPTGMKPLVAKKLSLPSPSLKGTTTFRLKGHANARIVAVAGSFNEWNQSQVLCGKEADEWVCRIDLAPGKYTYKFIIDGDWILDPANPDTEEDERGFTNSVLVVK
ncbi:MAG TPA: glycogen-binding domain-containing protein [Pyrinomonadaceae bacterium]|nr:glycogen-binding domain-containing protein [Pyrinomonadaceae bacterium]